MTSRNKVFFFVFIAWAIWLGLETLGLGPQSYLHIHDNADQSVPVNTWLTQSVHRLATAKLLPSMCGVARMPASAWFNVVQPFFLIFPPWAALGIFLILQKLVAAWFAFKVARDLFHLPPLFALAVGLIYPLLPYEHGEMRLMHQFNEPGFPLFLWAFTVLPVYRHGRATLIGIALGLLAGLGMGAADAIPFLLPSAVITATLLRNDLRDKRAWTGFLLPVVFCALTAAAVKLPNLVAIATHIAQSHRATWTSSEGLAETFRILFSNRLLLLSSLWPISLCSLAFLLQKPRKDRVYIAGLFLLLTSCLLGPILQAWAWQTEEVIGVLRGFDFTRFNRLAPFALLVTAFSGLRNLLQWRLPTPGTFSSREKIAFAVILGIALTTSWQIKQNHWAEMRRGATWAGLYGGADIKALAAEAKESPNNPFRCATAAAFHEYHPLYLLANGLETADGYAVVYPERYHKFWAQVIAPLVKSEPSSAGYFTSWGSRAYLFHSMSPGSEALSSIPFPSWYHLDLLSLANVRYLVSRKPLEDDRLILLPPTWDEASRESWSRRPLLARIGDYFAGRNPGPRQYVYQNPQALPRFFLAEGTRIIASPDALGDASLKDLSASVFLLRDDANDMVESRPEETPPGDYRLLSYHLEQSEIEVSVERDCWMVQSSLWYPGSRCKVDGQETKIYPAYGTFQAVRLKPGKHTAQWKLHP